MTSHQITATVLFGEQPLIIGALGDLFHQHVGLDLEFPHPLLGHVTTRDGVHIEIATSLQSATDPMIVADSRNNATWDDIVEPLYGQQTGHDTITVTADDPYAMHLWMSRVLYLFAMLESTLVIHLPWQELTTTRHLYHRTTTLTGEDEPPYATWFNVLACLDDDRTRSNAATRGLATLDSPEVQFIASPWPVLDTQSTVRSIATQFLAAHVPATAGTTLDLGPAPMELVEMPDYFDPAQVALTLAPVGGAESTTDDPTSPTPTSPEPSSPDPEPTRKRFWQR